MRGGPCPRGRGGGLGLVWGGLGWRRCCLPSSHTRGPSTWPESPPITSLLGPRPSPGGSLARGGRPALSRCLHGQAGFPTRGQPQRRLKKGGPEPQRSEGAGSVHSQTQARPLPATQRVCKACSPQRRGGSGLYYSITQHFPGTK